MRAVLLRRLETDEHGLALAREHAGVVALHPPEVREIEDVVGRADHERVELLLGHQRAHALELRVVSRPGHRVILEQAPEWSERLGERLLATPTDPTTSGRGRRRLAVRLLPRDHGVAQHADPLDLALHDVAGLEVERGGVGENPATPETVPVETTSPAEYPRAE